jgi:uncharacterized PurR-regulated membrane protein YhhQ (DUF165 family)
LINGVLTHEIFDRAANRMAVVVLMFIYVLVLFTLQAHFHLLFCFGQKNPDKERPGSAN